jgi:hypothetical protein
MSEPSERCNPHLKTALARRRGNNDKLVKELAKVPIEQQLELYRIIQDLEMEVDSERRKRKQGRMF